MQNTPGRIWVNGKKEVEFCNYNSPDDGTCLATNLSRSYYPNAYGLYNMSGNVAEMLETKVAPKAAPGKYYHPDAHHCSDEYAGFDDASLSSVSGLWSSCLKAITFVLWTAKRPFHTGRSIGIYVLDPIRKAGMPCRCCRMQFGDTVELTDGKGNPPSLPSLMQVKNIVVLRFMNGCPNSP